MKLNRLNHQNTGTDATRAFHHALYASMMHGHLHEVWEEGRAIFFKKSAEMICESWNLEMSRDCIEAVRDGWEVGSVDGGDMFYDQPDAAKRANEWLYIRLRELGSSERDAKSTCAGVRQAANAEMARIRNSEFA